MKNSISSFLLLALLTILFSCEDNSETNSEESTSVEGSAYVQFSLTDAPADFEAVLIDVVGLEYKIDTTASEDESTDDPDPDEEEDSENSEWYVADIEPAIYDLLQLNNGESVMLDEDEVPAGTLTEIRLILGDNNNVVIGEDTISLFVPSGSSSGLKIKLNQKIEDGGNYEVLIDFDAGMSIVERGRGDFLLKPVIRVSVDDMDDDVEVTGSITGTVTPSDIASVIYAIDSEDDSVSTQPEDDGSFILKMLEEGSFTISAVPSDSSGLQTVIVEDVVVEAGKTTDLDPIEFQE
jgi:hypothetical protein